MWTFAKFSKKTFYTMHFTHFHSFLDCTSNKPTVGAYKYTPAGCSKPSTCAMLAEKCHFWSKSNLPVRNTIHKRFRPFQPPLARYLQCHWSWRFTVWSTKAVGLQGHHWLKCSEIWWNLYAKFGRSVFKVGSLTAKRQLKSKINLSTCIKCLLIC